MRATAGRASAALRERLEARRGEIEEAALTRVRAISDPSKIAVPAYAEGLRAAVCAAVAYGIETTGRESGDAPIPLALFAQARMAARVAVPLDTVLRRYFAGYSLLGYFILEEASRAGISDGAELQRMLGTHAAIFDRLLAAIGEEHARESETMRRGSRRRLAERVERLLAGELLEAPEIAYDLDSWHLGVVVEGIGAEGHLRELARRLDTRPLLVDRGDGELWAWLGARARTDPAEAVRLVAATAPEGASVALGEPGEGLAGWRLTHRQALASHTVAVRRGEPVARYSDVALLASALQDDLLAASLRRLYLEPLEELDGGGEVARRTLRAYIAAERNVSSAASRLGVNRNTVASRLRAIEKSLGRPLSRCLTDLDAALRIEAVERSGTS